MGEGSKWALLVGIDKYHESLGSLKYAGADCRALRDVLVSGPLAFPEDQVLLLADDTDEDHRPTFANIHSFLGSWLSAPKADDLVFVYFAGHGRLVDGKNYLVPGDATLASLHTLGIPLRQVQDILERCKAKRKLLILDACHSGAGRDVAVMAGEMQAALAQGTGFYTIASCGAEELSHEWGDKGHGVFSYFLTEALRGECSPPVDGRLTVDYLYDWVHSRVVKWAAHHRCPQTPQRFTQGAGSVVLIEGFAGHSVFAEQHSTDFEQSHGCRPEKEVLKGRKGINKQAQGSSQRFTKSERLVLVSMVLRILLPKLLLIALLTVPPGWMWLAYTRGVKEVTSCKQIDGYRLVDGDMIAKATTPFRIYPRKWLDGRLALDAHVLRICEDDDRVGPCLYVESLSDQDADMMVVLARVESAHEAASDLLRDRNIREGSTIRVFGYLRKDRTGTGLPIRVNESIFSRPNEDPSVGENETTYRFSNVFYAQDFVKLDREGLE